MKGELPLWTKSGGLGKAGSRREIMTAVEGSHASHVVGRSLEAEAAWGAVQLGFAEILDLRTEIERRRYGAPPGAKPVSLAKHMASPEGPGSIYLCQHAIRSKVTLRRGAAEVAGGFARWQQAGLPVQEVD
jgi:rhodanese-related sulfurtransferase